jgi:hypothetical protein
MGEGATAAGLTRGRGPGPVAPRRLALTLLVVAGLVAAAGGGPADAAEVRFPLTVDYELLRVALRKHLTEEGGGVITLRSTDGCRTLTLREVTVQPAAGRLRVGASASALVGFGLFGWCWAQVPWDGFLEATGRPEIDAAWQLRLTDIDTQLYDLKRQQGGVAARVWDIARGWVEGELATFTYDLGPPVQELKTLLAAFATAERPAPLVAALDSLRPVGVAVDDDAVRVLVALDLPPTASGSAAPAPAPAPTPAELRRWQAALDGWDGFVGFAVKDLAGTTQDVALQSELLDILVDARREVVVALERGPEGGVDPVRALFLDVWERLRGLVRRVALQGAVESRALRYLTFLAAGDALAAIESAAPAAGLELSVDGLRRLARALDPAYAGDPVEYSESPDPALRRIFRFRDPDGPPRRAPRRPPGGGSWLAPRPAWADVAAEEWVVLGRRLDRWVPTPAELWAYRDTVARLLVAAADRSYDPDLLDERYEGLFLNLVKTVAWQESCWRQFVRQADDVVPLVSRTGDVGLMQINRRVWRGFFDPGRLTWNAAYNAGAGTEILLQLLLRYGTREAGARLENAARATYSAYNGGPRRYRRYRSANVPPALAAIDRAFWTKYQAMARGAADDLVLCRPMRPA